MKVPERGQLQIAIRVQQNLAILGSNVRSINRRYRATLVRCRIASEESIKNSRRLQVSISKNPRMEEGHKVQASVDPMFAAGLAFAAPKILEFKALCAIREDFPAI